MSDLEPGARPDPPESAAESESGSAGKRAAEALRKGNREPAFIRMFRSAREMLPGDPEIRTAQGLGGDRVSDVIVRFLSEPGTTGTTVTREAGLAAVQVWQAFTERAAGGGREVQTTILFTDLVGFSDWVLEAGDECGLELLREVAGVIEPAIKRRKGRIVKYLGDGHMAVFADPLAGVEAALDIQAALTNVEVHGHHPKLRAGLHVGTPQRVGKDFLGTDVNVAARVGAAARAEEVLISGDLKEAIDQDGLTLKRRRGFRAKGAPPDTQAWVVRRADPTPDSYPALTDR